MEWVDNVDISDDSPADYIPKYETRFTVDELSQMRYYHALPDGWTQMQYRVFLEERRKEIARVICDGFGRLLES